MPSPQKPEPTRDWSSDRTYEAAGLFITMLGSIERGRFTAASQTRAKLAALGYVIDFRPDRRTTADRKAVAR